jgi:hypothetical protein
MAKKATKKDGMHMMPGGMMMSDKDMQKKMPKGKMPMEKGKMKKAMTKRMGGKMKGK